MKKLILLYILLIVGCAAITGFKYKYGSTVQLTTEMMARNAGNIEYKSPQSQLKELEEKSQLEMWSEDKLKEKKDAITKGGYIIAQTGGATIGAAKTEYWDCIIQKMNGDEVDFYVTKQDYSIPNPSSGNWWDLFSVSINEPMEEPFKVFLISSIHQKKNEYIVYPNEKVTTSPTN